MAKCGIVPGCIDCDIEHDGAEDGRCCTVIFCDLHQAAYGVRDSLRVEVGVQAKLARYYRATARELRAKGCRDSALRDQIVADAHRWAFRRLHKILKLFRQQALTVSGISADVPFNAGRCVDFGHKGPVVSGQEGEMWISRCGNCNERVGRVPA